MSKVVQLKIEGDWEREGFGVTMSIGSEGEYPKQAIAGRLPPAPELLASLKDWQEKYQDLKKCYRIRPGRTFSDNETPSQRIDNCERSADQLKHRLWEWLDSQDFRQIDKRLREELNRSEAIGLIICTKDWQLQQLPWELWDCVDRYRNVGVALGPLEYESIPKLLPKTRKQKVKILAIMGDSKRINITEDRQLLEEKLPDAEIKFLIEPQRREINDQLWEQPWDIIFFAGHSQTNGETGKIDINATESLTIEDLSYGLRKAVEGGLRLAIFNSCEGLGLARELQSVHIPQVIVMREIVPDRVARAFLNNFLTTFAKGESLHQAVRDARERLQGLEDEYPCASWLPAIWQNPAEKPFTWADLLPKPEESLANKDGNKSQRKPWHQIGWVASVLLSIGSLKYGAPPLGKWVNNWGWENYLEDKWPEAIEKLELANKIDPQNPVPLYIQGYHCEDVRDFDCAKEKYRMAAKLGFAAAYCNLARLHILVDSDYAGAVSLSWQGMQFVDKEPAETQGHLNYTVHKNMGWARLGQGRYQEASEHLQIAIDLDAERAAGYCLLAQVKQYLGDRQGARENWQTCLEYGKPEKPEEDMWINMARENLKGVAQPREYGHICRILDCRL